MENLNKVFKNVAVTLSGVQSYPYLDAVFYLMMAMNIRKDTPRIGGKIFAKKHPFASWLATILSCFAGSILANLLVSEPLLIPLKNSQHIALASACWYLVNFCPFDLVFRLASLAPIEFLHVVTMELWRALKIRQGVSVSSRLFPNRAYLIWLCVGTAKGCGDLLLQLPIRCIYVTDPNVLLNPAGSSSSSSASSAHPGQLLKPSFTLKSSFVVSLLFLLEHLQPAGSAAASSSGSAASSDQIFFASLGFLVYFRVSNFLLGTFDLFVPLENIVSALFFGGLSDAIKDALNRRRGVETDCTNDNNGMKMTNADGEEEEENDNDLSSSPYHHQQRKSPRHFMQQNGVDLDDLSKVSPSSNASASYERPSLNRLATANSAAGENDATPTNSGGAALNEEAAASGSATSLRSTTRKRRVGLNKE